MPKGVGYPSMTKYASGTKQVKGTGMDYKPGKVPTKKFDSSMNTAKSDPAPYKKPGGY